MPDTQEKLPLIYWLPASLAWLIVIGGPILAGVFVRHIAPARPVWIPWAAGITFFVVSLTSQDGFSSLFAGS